MENLQRGPAAWSSSVLQKRIKDLQWLCSLDFFSPLQFGPSFYSPMSGMKSLQSGSAERTKGLQTYGVALQFLDKGNKRPIWILVNKPYEAVHLAMFFWCLLQEVDGKRVDEECFSFHFEEVDGEVWKMFSPTNWATKMAKLSDERTLGLDLGDTNSPVLRPTS